jgi:hypothetical protein
MLLYGCKSHCMPLYDHWMPLYGKLGCHCTIVRPLYEKTSSLDAFLQKYNTLICLIFYAL